MRRNRSLWISAFGGHEPLDSLCEDTDITRLQTERGWGGEALLGSLCENTVITRLQWTSDIVITRQSLKTQTLPSYRVFHAEHYPAVPMSTQTSPSYRAFHEVTLPGGIREDMPIYGANLRRVSWGDITRQPL